MRIYQFVERLRKIGYEFDVNYTKRKIVNGIPKSEKVALQDWQLKMRSFPSGNIKIENDLVFATFDLIKGEKFHGHIEPAQEWNSERRFDYVKFKLTTMDEALEIMTDIKNGMTAKEIQKKLLSRKYEEEVKKIEMKVEELNNDKKRILEKISKL